MRISDWSSDVCSSDLSLARLILSLEIFGPGSMSPPTPISTERTQPMSEQVHVEQVDRDFARDWDIECKHCSDYEGNYKAVLAEAAAKHRLAGEEDRNRDMYGTRVLIRVELGGG